jgi:hypothetical protein
VDPRLHIGKVISRLGIGVPSLEIANAMKV